MIKVTLIASRTNSPYNKELLQKINSCVDGEKKITAVDINKDQINKIIKDDKYVKFLEKIIVNSKNCILIRLAKRILKILNQELLKYYVRHSEISNTDIINLHYIEPFKVRLVKLILEKNPDIKIIASLWGSDFLRADRKRITICEYVYNKAEIITFNNEDVAEKFDSYFDNKFSEKIKIARFGLKSLELIDYYKQTTTRDILKNEYGYKEKYIICVGTNSKKEQQHLKIIDELASISCDILNNILFIFPLTYGDNENAERIKIKLSETKLKHIVLDSWIESEYLAKLRIMSDILIQLQTTDQFSGAMQEALYAESSVVTGSWLPYGFLKKKGVILYEISSFKELHKIVIKLLEERNSNILSKNAELIWELGSWEANINQWIDLYKSI